MDRAFHSLVILLVFSASLAPTAHAAECSASSGPNRTPLLELYTSEGCSSCPPADRWLSRFADSGHPGDKVVPLAFHVDYWDYIGWKDRFAKPAFTARQHAAAVANHSGFVYTPQVLLNGRDFRDWSSAARFNTVINAITREPSRARITLHIEQSPSSIVVDADAQADKNTALFVALYENSLSSEVERGENSGATLHHDFVVRQWLGPFAVGEPSAARDPQQIALDKGWKKESLGIAAFVQNKETGEVLQALSRPLCNH